MDLYSTARRLGAPFRFSADSDGELPIGARGIIGDGRTAALVRADGVIDWLCLPRFDSPSVFGALLDPERGGVLAVTPASRPFESLQRYDPDTNVLETLFRVEGQGVVRLMDFMPFTDDPRAADHEVLRRIECLEGRVELDLVVDPRFDYGREAVRFERHEHGVMCVGANGTRLAVTTSGFELGEREAGGVEARSTLSRGERRWVVLAWDAPAVEAPEAHRPWDKLRTTRDAWRRWTGTLRYDGPQRHHIIRSALLLKLLIYAPSGAMVAAPTTSLPEWVGGVRNWDYRYTWTRDTAMAIRAANRIGCLAEAREFFHFVHETLTRVEGLQIMYAVDGSEVPEEQVLSHLAGYRGSAPVRIGNGAKDQLQLDTVGALIDCAALYERYDGSLGSPIYRRLRTVIDDVASRWGEPDHGIWEPRGPKRHNVHSKLMSWLALSEGAGLARLFGDHPRASRYATEAERVKADVVAKGLDAKGRHFVTAYGIEEADAALLLAPIHGLVAPDDARASSTIEWLRAELGDGEFIHRYRMDDGVGGAEGAFVLCGFWLAEALALAGRVEEAERVFAAHAEDASNHLGLLAEEVDPRDASCLGNFPQAFSHLGLINAAVSIDEALER